MNCREFQEKWADSLEKDLSPDERKEWEAHQQACCACRNEIQSLEDLGHELKGIPPVSPLPPLFWNRQTESILHAIDRLPRRRWARFWDSLFQPRAAFASALVVVMLFFGYRYLNHSPVQLDSTDLAFLETDEDESILDLSEDQLDHYYAYTVQKYFPNMEGEEEEPGEGVWVEDLDDQELNRAIQYFQNHAGGRTL